jgi:salicylate hydroxylase
LEKVMRPQSQIRVVIVGGGIGGLFAANALVARGIAVSVYEQATVLSEVGAGLILTPNSIRHLRRTGLGPLIEGLGARIGPGSGYFRHDGTPISPYLIADSGDLELFGIHRADLVEILASALPKGVLHTGHRCTGFDQDGEAASVRFADGFQAEADLVVAADGIHSGLRHIVAPPAQPIFSGSIVYRGLVPREHIPQWPTNSWLMWMGPGKHFLAYPVRADTAINYAGFIPAHEASRESWSALGNPDALRREFALWDPRITSLLGHVEKTSLWALYDREALASWTLGRLTLLGDAAHPMLPHVGQGANQSIEDGIALATILAHADRATIPAALIAYERVRRERVTAIQRRARENGRRYDSANVELDKRDAEIPAQVEYRKQLYAYDVVAEAQFAAAALPTMAVQYQGQRTQAAGRLATKAGTQDVDLP